MKLAVTNDERAGLAVWLATGNWAGTEEQLGALADVFEACALEEYRQYVTPDPAGNVELPKALLSRKAQRRVTLSTAAVEALLALYPPRNTPPILGLAKVRLLRKLRALVPREEPKKG